MARHTGPRLKIVRRFGQHLPGLTRKSAENRPYPPGQHGLGRRPKASDYRIRLEEKQKLRLNYGLNERQLRTLFRRAAQTKGDTGQNLLQLLESRLDNVVYRAGFAATIPAARQLVTHGHVLVNGRKVTIPSYALKVNDVVEIKDSNVSRQLATRHLELSTNRVVPEWLSFNKEQFRGTVLRLPTREEIQPIANEQAVVEFYSR